MTTRLMIAYLLILLLVCGGGAGIWWMVYNSPRQRLRRYYRAKHGRQDR
jgi:hypothetical protein